MRHLAGRSDWWEPAGSLDWWWPGLSPVRLQHSVSVGVVKQNITSATLLTDLWLTLWPDKNMLILSVMRSDVKPQ